MKTETNSAAKAIDVQRLVRPFHVMHQTGEYDYEMSCGPYATYEEAEKARKGWFKKHEISQMRVVQFYQTNDQDQSY